MARRVEVRSFDAVCRAVEARLGIGILPLAAARSFVHAMQLKVLSLTDAWASRHMHLVARSQPPMRRRRWARLSRTSRLRPVFTLRTERPPTSLL